MVHFEFGSQSDFVCVAVNVKLNSLSPFSCVVAVSELAFKSKPTLSRRRPRVSLPITDSVGDLSSLPGSINLSLSFSLLSPFSDSSSPPEAASVSRES